MDRNCSFGLFGVDTVVALRKESVDRNGAGRQWDAPMPHVALRKESVDRNRYAGQLEGRTEWSLSARRAWIEITDNKISVKVKVRSLSARRAWIEIIQPQHGGVSPTVALRKESVDRNCRVRLCPVCQWRRSPQGERG